MERLHRHAAAGEAETELAPARRPVPIEDLPTVRRAGAPPPAGRKGARLLGFGLAGLLTLACAAGAWVVLGKPPLGIDDADIAQVYGRNLAAGHGLVYTPGFERVEGYSSPTWMLVWALAHGVTSRPVLWASALSFLLCAWSVACLLGITERLGVSGRRGLLVLGLFLTLPGFFAWNVLTLMDLGLWTALIATFLFLTARDLTRDDGPRRAWPLAAVLAGLVLTRPEGVVLAPACLLLAVIAGAARGEGLRSSLRRHAWSFAWTAIASVGLLGFRLAYFGYPLPNTYYAKVSPDRIHNLLSGLRYNLSSVETMPWMVVFLPVAMAVLGFGLRAVVRGARRAASERSVDGSLLVASVAAALTLVGFSLPLIEGGDHFGAHRLLQPFLIPAAVPTIYVLARMVRSLPDDLRARWMTALPRPMGAILLLSAIAVTWLGFRATSGLGREFRIAQHGRSVGTALSDALGPESLPSVGVVTAGGFALGYEGRVLDLMGLNWEAMGHSPGSRYGVDSHTAFDNGVFWQAPPELLLPQLHAQEPSAGATPPNGFDRAVLAELFASPRFEEEYEPRMLRTGEGFILAYARKDWDSAFEPLPRADAEAPAGGSRRSPPVETVQRASGTGR